MGNVLSSMLSQSETTAWLSLVVVIFIFFYLRKDTKSIKENLNNHVTDTDKKIDKLDIKIDKLDTKIGNIDTKLDTKFDRLNSRLDKVFNNSKNTSVSK